LSIESGETNYGSSFDYAERDALVSQRDDTHNRPCAETNEVSCVYLDLQTTITVGRDRVAFNQGEIKPRAFPILVSRAFQAHFTADQADTHHSRLYVIIIRLVVESPGSRAGRKYCKNESEKNQGDRSGTHVDAPSVRKLSLALGAGPWSHSIVWDGLVRLG
jgi:hypothetical protein